MSAVSKQKIRLFCIIQKYLRKVYSKRCLLQKKTQKPANIRRFLESFWYLFNNPGLNTLRQAQGAYPEPVEGYLPLLF